MKRTIDWRITCPQDLEQFLRDTREDHEADPRPLYQDQEGTRDLTREEFAQRVTELLEQGRSATIWATLEFGEFGEFGGEDEHRPHNPRFWIEPENPDRRTLTLLHQATQGERWRHRQGWLTEEPLGRWHGVTTNPMGRVTRIDLTGNNLQGAIPPELGGMDCLEELDLRDNLLQGEIPPEAARIPTLKYLFLQDNRLTGEIPVSLCGHPQITEIGLDNNQLEGEIPSGLANSPRLAGIFLSGCGLTGPIPSHLGASPISAVRALDLAYNKLTWEIPRELEALDLDLLFLQGNDLTGWIPRGLWSIRDHDLEELGLPRGPGLNNPRRWWRQPDCLRISLEPGEASGSWADGDITITKKVGDRTLTARMPGHSLPRTGEWAPIIVHPNRDGSYTAEFPSGRSGPRQWTLSKEELLGILTNG